MPGMSGRKLSGIHGMFVITIDYPSRKLVSMANGLVGLYCA